SGGGGGGGGVARGSALFPVAGLPKGWGRGPPPFRGDSAAEILQRICTWDPPPARSLSPAVPESLSSFIARLLAKDPRKRPAGAAEALAGLDEILPEMAAAGMAGSFPAARSASGSPTLLSRAVFRGRPGWRVAAGIAVLTALAAAGVWLRKPARPVYIAVPETVVTTLPGDNGKDSDLAAGAVRTALLQGLLGFQRV